MNMLNSMTDRLPDWFVKTPAGQAAVTAQREAAAAARQADVATLTALRCKAEATVVRYGETLRPLEAAEQAARGKWQAAVDKVATMHRERAAMIHSLEHQAAEIERRLVSTAAPRIDEAKHAMATRFDRARIGLGRTDQIQVQQKDPWTGQPMVRPANNLAAIERLVAAMTAARGHLDNLKLSNPADLDGAIAAVLAPVEQAWARVGELGVAQ